MDLLARYEAVNGVPVVVLEGVIDLSTLPALHDHLTRAVNDHSGVELAIDLDAVAAIDDSGLGLLLGAAGRCRELGGELVVIASSERLRARFALTGLDRAVAVRARLA